MEKNETGHHHEAHEFVMLFVSILALGLVLVETLFALSPWTSLWLHTADTIVCVFFLSDFFLDLYRAPKKLAFLKWGWVDFISSIPSICFPGFDGIGRALRLLRILRAVRAIRIILHFIYWRRARSVLATVALISFTLMIFAAVSILNCEDHADSNIKTPADALWWAFATITTVGYGDKYPVTPEGRVIAAVLMTVGVGLFGTMTACIAAFFFQNDSADLQKEIAGLRDDVKQLRESIERDRDAG